MKPTLTNISIIARKVIRYGTYLIILAFIVRFLFKFGYGIYQRAFPAPPPDPTAEYVLTNLPFPEKPSPSNPSYVLETPDGELPVFTDQMKVFLMPRAATNIKVLDTAKKTALSLGFNSNGTELAESVYEFKHKSAPSKLILNIITNVFSISYDIASNPSVIGRIPPAPESATTLVKSFLSKAGFLNEDLSGPVTHEFLRIEGGRFTEAVSLSEADLIKVNFYRKDYVKDIPTVTPDFSEANVWFIISGSQTRSGSSIIAGEYHYYPINEKETSTYPIKTSQDAWDDLREGKAFFANLGDNSGNIVVRRVYLAYYDAGQYTEFFQPVVVFEGDNDFAAYVPAITDNYYGPEEKETDS